MGELLGVLGKVLGVLALMVAAWYRGYEHGLRRESREQNPFLTYLQSRVAELERQVDGMHQRGLVSPSAPPPPEPVPASLPHEVETMIDGFEDPEVQVMLRSQAADHFARFPAADPAQYVADLLRDR